MKKLHFIILLYFFTYGTLGHVLSTGNDQKENKFLSSPTSGKTYSILRDILKQESSLHFSMVQKIQNLVMDAKVNKNITEILKEKLAYLGKKINVIQSKNQRLEETLDESLDDFREDQNVTKIQLQNIASLHHSKIVCFLPSDCFYIYNCGERETGVYEIYPITTRVPIQVRCDMGLRGGGWTVIQQRKRENPHVNFNTTWNEYKRGFGDVRWNYWLGNEVIYKLTTKYNNSLYIRLETTKNQSFEVQYSLFSISDETDGYKLSLGLMSGKIVDAFRSYRVVGFPFFTFDNDNKYRCAAECGSGWWYDYCTRVNLNAPFFKDHLNYVWYGTSSKGSDLFLSEMLIRRT